MNVERHKVAIAQNPRKKKLLRSSMLRALWNRIGQRQIYLNCFGCGDSLWWKEDVGIAFRKPDKEDSAWRGEDDFLPQENQNFYEISQRDNNVIIYRHGVVICRECFVKKSERELIQVFENVKKQWSKNKSTREAIQDIANYKLLLPIRTTTGIFKKEMTEISRKYTSSVEQILPSE